MRQVISPSAFAEKTVTRVAVLAAAVVCFAGCSLFQSKQLYDDVYYTANFIEGIQFDRFVGADNAVPATAVTGQWDLAYRYLDWDGYDYITLTNSGNTAADFGAGDGLTATAPVYRLEVVNLLDGGNFEAGAETWSPPGAGIGIASQQTAPVPLFGTGCAHVNLTALQSITYYSTQHAGFSGFTPAATYNVFFRYFSKTETASVLVNGVSAMTLGPTGDGVKGYAKYTLNNAAASAPEFTFKPIDDTSILSELYVDNFRVGRSGNMELRLYLAIADTTPALESGTYSFSVWAYTDPLATTVQTPYPADAFVVKMAACSGTTNLSTTSVTYAAAAGWQKLTATLKPGALAFAWNTLDPVLSLVLDFNQTRPGSVLLAQPELRFYPDGI